MRFLKEIREKRNFTQAEVAIRCGMSRQHLSRLENGRSLATPEQARALGELYGVSVLCNEHLLDERIFREQSGARLFDLERVNPDNWRAADRYWGSRLRRLGLSPETWEWMSTFLPSDSTKECYGLGQIAAKGAEPCLANPHQWGFDLHVVVDRFGKLPGARMLPALTYTGPDNFFIFWPQVNLRIGETTFRLDGLMFYRRGSDRYWLNEEFDGAGHDHSKDPYRSGQIGMMEVRIKGEEVLQNRTFPLLIERTEAEIARLAAGTVAV